MDENVFPWKTLLNQNPSLTNYQALVRAGINGEQIFDFSFHQNQNSPLIGERKTTPPQFKSSRQSEANFDFDEMKNRKSVLR